MMSRFIPVSICGQVYAARSLMGPWNDTGLSLNPIVNSTSGVHLIRAQVHRCSVELVTPQMIVYYILSTLNDFPSCSECIVGRRVVDFKTDVVLFF